MSLEKSLSPRFAASIFGASEFTFVTVKAEINIRAIPGRCSCTIVLGAVQEMGRVGRGGEEPGIKMVVVKCRSLHAFGRKYDRSVTALRTF